MESLQSLSSDPVVMYEKLNDNGTENHFDHSTNITVNDAFSPSHPLNHEKASCTTEDTDSLKSDRNKVSYFQSSAQKKLTQASFICAVFMIVEAIAGICANSLALLTDASHLMSDLSSFLISLFSLWVATLPGTSNLSFGYHRAEILSALISVVAIWILTVLLMIEAYKRLSNPSPVNGSIMFVTAFLGTLANLVITYILGVHSHGLGTCSNHSSHKPHVHHDHENQLCDSKTSHNLVSRHCKNTENLDLCTSLKNSVVDYEHTLPSPHTKGSVKGSGVSPDAGDKVYHESKKQVSFNLYDDSTLNPTKKIQKKNFWSKSFCAVASFVFPPTQTNSTGLVPHDDHNNVNLRAAYLHAAGDLIQNIGVLLAAVIIWFKPSWSIIDPLCTFFFSLLVLATTPSIVFETVNVLMEGVPKGIDLYRLRNDLQNLRNVIEVHDLHVWSLSVGKPSLACHIVVNSQAVAKRVLRKATHVCQKKYGILHTTVQIDYSTNKQSCDTDAHSKCH